MTAAGVDGLTEQSIIFEPTAPVKYYIKSSLIIKYNLEKSYIIIKNQNLHQQTLKLSNFPSNTFCYLMYIRLTSSSVSMANPGH